MKPRTRMILYTAAVIWFAGWFIVLVVLYKLATSPTPDPDAQADPDANVWAYLDSLGMP